MIRESKSPGQLRRIEKEKKTSEVETWRWTKCSSKRDSQMDSACKREDAEFLHWHILRSATGILFSQQVANWVFLGFSPLKRYICYKATWSFGASSSPCCRETGIWMRWGAKGDLLVKDAVVANCLLPSSSVFLKASKSRMANALLLFSLVACSLSWNLGCFCYSELSPVFPNTAHINLFFILSSLSPNPWFQEKDFFLLGRTSWRSGGKYCVVNTKVTQSFIRPDFSPLGLSRNYTYSNLGID